jgi:sec-independent protein translocase protein TatC
MSTKEKLSEDEENTEELGFWGHLEELRKRIFIAVFGIVIGCIISGVFIEPLMNIVLLGPAARAHLHLQNLKPFGVPFLYFKVIFIVGFIIAFPFVLYQLWKFIAPGLYENEKKWAGTITFFTTLCFLCGIAFAYFFMIPSMLAFSATFGTSQISNNIDVNEYFGFVSMMLLGSGIIFEMPMVSFVLARVGIINHKMLRKFWRHAVVVILIIAAILTPSPDPINQLFFATPLFVLYELSIWVAKFSAKPKLAENS